MSGSPAEFLAPTLAPSASRVNRRIETDEQHLAGRARRRLAPELLEAVELAGLGGEDVDDDVEVVHQDPAGLRRSLDPSRQRVVVALEPLKDAVLDRFSLPAGVAR